MIIQINQYLGYYRPYVLTTDIVRNVSYRLTPIGFRYREASVLVWKKH